MRRVVFYHSTVVLTLLLLFFVTGSLSQNELAFVSGKPGDKSAGASVDGILKGAIINAKPTNNMVYGFFAEEKNHIIRTVASNTGTITTIAGQLGINGFNNGNGTMATFKRPMGLAISNDFTSLYVCDYGNKAIRVITRSAPYIVSTGLVLNHHPKSILYVPISSSVNIIYYLQEESAGGTQHFCTNTVQFTNETCYTLDFTNSIGFAQIVDANTFFFGNGNLIYKYSIFTNTSSVFASGFGNATGLSAAKPSISFSCFPVCIVNYPTVFYIVDSQTGTVYQTNQNGVLTLIAGQNTTYSSQNDVYDTVIATQASIYSPLSYDALSNEYVILTSHSVRSLIESAPSFGYNIFSYSNNILTLQFTFGVVNSFDNITVSYMRNFGETVTQTIQPFTTESDFYYTFPYVDSFDSVGFSFTASNKKGVTSTTPFLFGYNETVVAGSGASDNPSYDGVGTNSAIYAADSGFALDHSNNDVYFTEYYNQILRKMDSNFNVTTIAGKKGTSGTSNGVGTNALFNSPSVIALDSKNGYVYIAVGDSGNDIGIRRYQKSNKMVTTLIGNGVASALSGNYIGSLALNSNNTILYILSSNTHYPLFKYVIATSQLSIVANLSRYAYSMSYNEINGIPYLFYTFESSPATVQQFNLNTNTAEPFFGTDIDISYYHPATGDLYYSRTDFDFLFVKKNGSSIGYQMETLYQEETCNYTLVSQHSYSTALPGFCLQINWGNNVYGLDVSNDNILYLFFNDIRLINLTMDTRGEILPLTIPSKPDLDCYKKSITVSKALQFSPQYFTLQDFGCNTLGWNITGVNTTNLYSYHNPNQVQFNIASNSSGTRPVHYQIWNGIDEVHNMVTNITIVNHNPVINNSTFTWTYPRTSQTFPNWNLLSDCTDPDGDNLTVVQISKTNARAANSIVQYDPFTILFVTEKALLQVTPNGQITLSSPSTTNQTPVTAGTPLTLFWKQDLSFQFEITDGDVSNANTWGIANINFYNS